MKKIIFFLSIFFFLNNCGYQPVFDTTKKNFSIGKIRINENIIGTKVKNSLNFYSDRNGLEKIFDLDINISKKIQITSKDTKGNAKTFNMIIYADLNVSEKNNKILEKKFSESFGYNNNSNKFDLNRYEDTIENNLINKIIQNITLQLYSL